MTYRVKLAEFAVRPAEDTLQRFREAIKMLYFIVHIRMF